MKVTSFPRIIASLLTVFIDLAASFRTWKRASPPFRFYSYILSIFFYQVSLVSKVYEVAALSL